ncbi:putative membrane transporter protein [Frankia sp. Hr75.2]|uniref:sulfite exporter TauE/SafE family protein n=1 Tax=Parafrankia TaxID=2994362 RepID=UPI000DA52B65|nr:sulfite exporter TauE/SafE family protein [Parafrankia sp. Ea1.12]CAI7977322.1 putative membrane transporter protein [Frankia sp. Hr75.2]SQD97844.1 putative permease [Parafrankia sp. Ea1.12]
MIAALGLGAAIGILLGLLGGGGSILAVPALIYGAGLSVTAAVPTSLLVVGISSAAALLPRLRTRQIRWRIAAIVGTAGALAAFGGAALNQLLDPRLVLIGLAALMGAAAVRMLRGDGEAGGDCSLPDGGVNWRGCLPKAIGTGIAVGFLTGLFGVGGGFLLIPALVLLLGLPMPAAVGTSLVVIVINSAAGFAAHAGEATLDYRIAAAFTAAAVIGSLTAGRFATRVPAERLRGSFAYLVLAVAAFVVLQAVVNPPAS